MARTMSSREFNQNPSEAKRAAETGPVVVTDRGQPAFVLLRYDAYRRLSGGGSIVDRLRQDEPDADFEFEPPKLGGELLKPAELD